VAAADDLSTPLGQDKPKPRRIPVPAVVPRAIAGVLGLCLLVFAVWLMVVDDPYGGEPIAVVATGGRSQPPGKPADGRSPPSPSGADAGAAPMGDKGSGAARGTVTIIDGMSGKRQEVPIGQPATSGGAAKPTGGDAAGRTANPGQGADTRAKPPIDPRLVEMTQYGPIPKIGPDGARAGDVYARPASSAAGKPGPRVAIVVSGLGVGAAGTSEALARLPGSVTLAFSPYETDIERWVNRARGEGHEILMQVPMEPVDYPDNDPGPRTLLTTVGADQNLDRLHWFMSRFQGYVGVANYMGARFTANETAAAPVLADVAKRGLIYFDDATSPRSLANQLSGASSGAFAKADVALDAVPTGAEIDNALARLEAVARDHGVAVGTATALPLSIDRIAQWAKAAEGRGLALVPISAVASKPKST